MGVEYIFNNPIGAIMVTDIRPQTSEVNQGFFDGRQFRAYLELNIPKGGVMWMRFTAGSDFLLYDQRISLLSGEVRWSAVAFVSDSPGPWAPSTFGRRNQMSRQQTPLYVSTNAVETSNSASAVVGGKEVDVMWAGSTGATAIQQNAGPRGLPPGSYHVRLDNPSNEAAVGVYDWWWEERP